MPSLRALLVVALVLPLAGCALPWQDDEGPEGPAWPPTRPTAGTPPSSGPPLVWGGVVVDAVTGEAIPSASVRLDLSAVQPCRNPGLGWTSWEFPVAHDGTFGPEETARPASDDVAFFLNAEAPGYARNTTYIGPTEARAGTRNLTLALHPDAAIEGTAPPGTLVALEAPTFPRVTVAGEDGRFAFPRARAVDAALVVGTDPVQFARARPPANLTFTQPDAAPGWTLDGALRHESGAPLGADIVAWNGTRLVGVARAGDNGVFTLHLPAEPGEIRIDARTSEGRYGGIRTFTLNGPPALRETVLMRALC